MKTIRRVSATATVVLGGLGAALFPRTAELSAGWITPIVAFEFARTPADLSFLFVSESVRSAMDAGHIADSLFPFAYGSLIALSAIALLHTRLKAVVITLSVVAIGFDLAENQVLSTLTSAAREGKLASDALSLLPYITWCKWTALAVSLAALSTAFTSWRRVSLRLALLLTPFAMLTNFGPLCEAFAGTIVLGFLLLVTDAFWGRQPTESMPS